MADPILETDDLTKSFSGLVAVDGVSIQLERNQITGLIGPNGAGKTTLLNLLTGILKPDRGSVYLNGEDISGESPRSICKRGLIKTYQVPKPFNRMTVAENVAVGSMFGNERDIGVKEAKEDAYDWLEFVGIEELAATSADTLNHSMCRQMEIARTLATRPTVLLLDEVLAGLNSDEINRSLALIRRIRDELDISVVWVEHIIEAVNAISDEIVVLHLGEKIAQGPPRDVMENATVQSAYLGGTA